MTTVPIGKLTESVGTWNPSRRPDEEFEYIDLSAVDNDSKSIIGSTRLIGAEAPSRARQVVAAGDVLVSTVRPNLNAVAMVPGMLDGATASTGFTVLRPSPKLEGRYLFHWVRSPSFVNDMVRRATGASYPAVSDRIIKGSAIPAPPLDGQRRIAAILDQADALRAKRRQVLAQLYALTQSIFHDMFGDRDWPTEPLGDRLDFLTSGSRGWAKHYAVSGDIFLRIQNVRRDELRLDDLAFVRAPATEEAKRTAVRPGDVLLSITADLGRTAVVPDHLGTAYINQHLSILRATTIAPRYLSAFLTSPEGQRQIAGRNRAAVKAGLNFDDVRSLEIPLPEPALQREFSDRVEGVTEPGSTERI